MLQRRLRPPRRLLASGIALVASTGIAGTALAQVAVPLHPGFDILPMQPKPAPATPRLQLAAATVPAAPATTQAPSSTPWHLSLAPVDPTLLHRLQPLAAGGDGVTVAQHLLVALRGDGYPLVHATVNAARHTIALRIAHFGQRGPLAQYLPGGKTVTTGRLKSALPLLTAAAVARHEHVDLGLDRSMALTPTVSAAPGRAWRIGTVFSSYGPRYAGSDVLSGYGYAHVGGFDLSASVTRGLPGLTPKQSSGGSYLGQSIEIDRPTTAGIFSIAASHAHYLTGGPLRPLRLTGTVTQIRGGDRYPVFDGHVWLKGGMEWSSDRERLGALAWTTTQRNLSGYVGAVGHYAWHGVAIGLRGSVWRGLTGSDSASHGSPNLMGDWSAHYTVERVRLTVARNIGPVRLSGIFGWQHGSAGTPQVMQAYIGGRHRGSSFFTGAFAGPSGYWWSAEVAKAKPVRFQLRGIRFAVDPYAGVNGGTVSPVIGPSERVTAVTVGVSFSISRHVTGSIGWSHTIAESAGIRRGNMIGFNVTTSF